MKIKLAFRRIFLFDFTSTLIIKAFNSYCESVIPTEAMIKAKIKFKLSYVLLQYCSIFPKTSWPPSRFTHTLSIGRPHVLRIYDFLEYIDEKVLGFDDFDPTGATTPSNLNNSSQNSTLILLYLKFQ